MHFNHNGSLLVTGGIDGVVRVFDMSTNYSSIMKWKMDDSDLSCVRFSRDETAVYTVSATGGVCVVVFVSVVCVFCEIENNFWVFSDYRMEYS